MTNLETFLKNSFLNLDYKKAIKILKNEFINGIENNGQINSLGEKYLLSKNNNNAVFLNNFPSKLIPFYQKNDSKTSINSDFLIGIGETIGIGQRCESANEVLDSIKLHKNNPQEYNWYIEMKKKFPLTTSGFGVGIERLILFLINENDIRNVVVLPRDTNENIEP